MRLSISRDYFDGSPTPPRLFLCTPSGKKMGELPAYDRSGAFKWNTYSEFSFSVNRTYVDILTGETKVHPLYDKVESPRQVYVENICYAVLQDIDDTSNDNDTKSVTCFSAEYAVANKYLTSFYINTGEIGSREVTYNESLYGLDYSSDVDSFYILAAGSYNPYESYYIKQYTDTEHYTYQQAQVDAQEYSEYLEKNADTLAQPHEKLYMKKFANVQFYNPDKQGLSLLHLILEDIPDWKINDGTIDRSLWQKERTFSQDRISVYDFLMNDVAETFGCIFEWDTLTKTLYAYEEAEDGVEENGEIQTRWATDVFISKDNLASEVQVKYSADNIKTKLTVSGGEDLTISEVNLDRNEIMNLSFYHNLEWMEQDLYDAYNHYLDALKEAETGLDRYGLPSKTFPMSHSDAVQKWVAAQNKWNDLTHEVPVEGNTVLVGDEFKKLYCMYTPIDTAFVTSTIQDVSPIQEFVDLYSDAKCTIKIIKESLSNGDMFIVQGHSYIYKSASNKFEHGSDIAATTSLTALIKKLNQYHVDDDYMGNKPDNILLKLKNQNSDTAIIRIYDLKQLASNSYNPDLSYYEYKRSASGVVSYTKLTINDNNAFDKAYQKGNLYTNNYTIQSVVTRADSGISDRPSYWSMSPNNLPSGATYKPFEDWVKGELSAEEMGFVEYDSADTDKKNPITYTISQIGTMGAYFVLAENEFDVVGSDLVPSKDYLRKYGVNLLREKHKTYTTIFQTQTEAMFSQDGYQCTVGDNPPSGTIDSGTRWLDTNSNPVQLKSYTGSDWVVVSASLSPEEQKKYEDYQRYIDNYQRLQVVQEVLMEKEREAEYCLNGVAVSDRKIDITRFKMDGGVLRYNGRLLEEDMLVAAEAHFAEISATTHKRYVITRVDMNQNLPLYTFMTSYDPIKYGPNVKSYNPSTQYYKKVNDFAYAPIDVPSDEEFAKYTGDSEENTLYVVQSGHIYAVYLRGTTPYVAYMDSQGVYQMIRDYIRKETELNKFFNEDQWIRLSPFIREDEFTDSNFFWNGYDSEEQKIQIMDELMEAANKELNTLCQPSLEFSMTMANILALPEFAPLVNQFQLGNFIRVKIRENYIKRARLLEVTINFDDLSDFSCTFGNLVTTKSEIDKHADLLSQAITAGKQVAVAAGTWQRSADKVNKIEESLADGFSDATLQIGRASGQAITWDENGFYCRKFAEGSTEQYADEQIAIINNKIVFTNDGWKTSKAALGEFQVDIDGDNQPETMYGLLANAVVSGYIQGSVINGGSLKIGGTGGTFIVNEDGSTQILGPNGTEKYTNDRFQTRLVHSGPTVFSNFDDECIVTCYVYDYGEDITQKVIDNGGTFTWSRSMSGWTPTYVSGKPNAIKVKHTDIDGNSQVDCLVDFDETKFNI